MSKRQEFNWYRATGYRWFLFRVFEYVCVMLAIIVIFVVMLFSSGCASHPAPPGHPIKCAVYVPKGSYGVRHRMDSRNGIYDSRRWRCEDWRVRRSR